WHGEGLPREVTDRYEIYRHFGLELYRQDWFAVCKPSCPKPAAHGAGLIRTEADYDLILPHLYPPAPENPRVWETWAREQERGDSVLWFTVEGFFWFPRRLLGIERHLFAFYDQPQLIHRINTDLSEWILRSIERLCSICIPDFMTFAEDMSYNHGPMLSKDMFDEFMRPYYDRIIPALHERGILAIVDSDGNIHVPARWFAEAGLDGILPLERQSGVDIACLRRDHPTMRFIGHFDKTVMHRGEQAMRREFERLLPIAALGGFLPSCDHQTPPTVSYADYRLYLDLFREYAEKAGQSSRGRHSFPCCERPMTGEHRDGCD
ncbi:MAG: hypothetical protein N2255_07530, partial [Kiritimatiellae bacterium]|nr:hypothetical protein [Kiritimatiellia bacterium]